MFSSDYRISYVAGSKLNYFPVQIGRSNSQVLLLSFTLALLNVKDRTIILLSQIFFRFLKRILTHFFLSLSLLFVFFRLIDNRLMDNPSGCEFRFCARMNCFTQTKPNTLSNSNLVMVPGISFIVSN